MPLARCDGSAAQSDLGCDSTYILLLHGWRYLVAIIDWYSRYVISWALDETLEIGFVLNTIEQALTSATPEIWNTDQGSHFTSPQVIRLWKQQGFISVLMARDARRITCLPSDYGVA